MPPKKESKVQEVKQAQPQLKAHELVGYGRFEYLGGVRYEGNWKLLNKVKKKHGWGRLIISPSEHYEGDWQADHMEGYGIYHYPDGCVYSGQWHEDRHEGRGRLDMANGTWYDGEWRNHLMHGQGIFHDQLGRDWKGQFRDGIYGSRNQIELVKEKVRATRDQNIKLEVVNTVKAFIVELEKQEQSNKIYSFFEVLGCCADLIEGDLVQLRHKSKQQWLSLLKSTEGGNCKVVQSQSASKLIPIDRLKANQLQGRGQIVELYCKNEQNKGLALVQMKPSKWIIAYASED